ncbi:thiol methyltransferase [Aspergillus insuetus]
MSGISLKAPSVHSILDKHSAAGNPYNGWEELWSRGDDLPWDKGAPNPALAEAITTKADILRLPRATCARKRALVPGCGRGLDVLLLASFGYDAYGLEYSKTAIDVARKEQDRAEQHDKYPVKNEIVGRGKITWLQGDFFNDEWLEAAGLTRNCFDLIYDNTFFCALDPSMRSAWALRYTQLLAASPEGNLVCLEFPRHRDPSERGPPWPSPSEAYVAHLSHPGKVIAYDAKGRLESEPLRDGSKLGLERVSYWTPERTHDFGTSAKGEVLDRVSVWRLK